MSVWDLKDSLLGGFSPIFEMSFLEALLYFMHMYIVCFQSVLHSEVLLYHSNVECLVIAGVVRYIGKLEADALGQIFIGVHLVMPGKFCIILHSGRMQLGSFLVTLHAVML